jgi:cell division protein FtsL
VKTNRYKSSKSGSLRKKVLSAGMKDPWAGVGAPKTGAFAAARGTLRGGDWRGLVGVLAVCGAVAAAGLFRVWTRAESQALAYAIVADEGRVRTAESERQRLTLEAASLSSPIRIATLAHQKLSLHTPSADQIVLMDGATPDDVHTSAKIAAR